MASVGEIGENLFYIHLARLVRFPINVLSRNVIKEESHSSTKVIQEEKILLKILVSSQKSSGGEGTAT